LVLPGGVSAAAGCYEHLSPVMEDSIDPISAMNSDSNHTFHFAIMAMIIKKLT
jgi:hypothetical protein